MEKTILEKDFRKAALNLLIKCGQTKENAAVTISKEYKEAIKEIILKEITERINKDDVSFLNGVLSDKDDKLSGLLTEMNAQIKFIKEYEVTDSAAK